MIDQHHSAMEGGGYYNAHSHPQAAASDLGIPLLQRAASSVADTGSGFAIADLGSSQGKNSLAPMVAAIAALRARSANATITVTHTDLPENDFNSLFELVATSPDSYLRGQTEVYAYAAAGSFYGRLFRAASIDLGWNSIAVHWLSSLPCSIPDHIWSTFATGNVREQLRRRAADDWGAFLQARSVELRSGAQLVIVASCADDDGRSGAEGLMEAANAELLELVQRGTLARAQYEAMTIPTYYRTAAEFEEPLRGAHPFELLEATPTMLQDPFWAAYAATGDATAYATNVTQFFRAFSEPCLFQAAARSPVADAFYAGVEKRVAADPAAASCHWRLLLIRLQRRQ